MTDMTAEQAFEIVDAELRLDIPAGGSQVVRAWAIIRQALTAPRVPEGWSIKRSERGEPVIIVSKNDVGGYAAGEDGRSGIAESILYHLCNDMLTAAPSPAEQTTDVNGMLVTHDSEGRVSKILQGGVPAGDELTKLRGRVKVLESLVADDQIKIREQDEALSFCQSTANAISMQIVCVGGPLNDNGLGYSSRQLVPFHHINVLAEEIADAARLCGGSE